MALNLSDAPVTVEGSAGTVLIATDRARDGERVDGALARRRGAARWSMPADELDPLLSDEGWPYASTPPVEEGDPGRFHALFGRDSLICALQVLPARPDVARGHAARAGGAPGHARRPGHAARSRARSGTSSATARRRRSVELGWPDEGAFAYYGTADATSWFLRARDAGDAALGRRARAAWRAAGGWLERRARARRRARPARAAARGRRSTQQGWRDTVDPTASATAAGSCAPDGTAPRPPLADADSQAVAYAALRALAVLDRDDGWERRARDALRARLSARLRRPT